MAVIDLGNIRINWRGAYNAAAEYVQDDAVSYHGSSYIACMLIGLLSRELLAG